MAVLSREEFFSNLNTVMGTNTSDDAMQFIEDMTDTYNDLENRANGSDTDWEKKYHELDAAWKTKYTRRFFSSGGRSNIPESINDEQDDEQAKRASTIAIKDLFS